jgi:uncharacterized membrane-anchored protein YjiN (DUF445 family)
MNTDTPRAARARRLLKAKLLATGAVLFAAALFLIAPHLPLPVFWRKLLVAAGEAGTVGGLADWFAVTALFRRPLGLPIPHTALIPNRKDEIGRQLARFIEEHFLDRDLLIARLKEKDRAEQLGLWLQAPKASHFVAGRLVAVMRGLVNAGTHLDLVDAVLPLLRSIAEGLEEGLAREVGRRTGPFVPELIDRSLARAGGRMVGGVIKALGVAGSPERAALDAWLRARFAEAPPELQDSARAVWDRLRSEMLGPGEAPSPELQATLARLVERMGEAIIVSPAMRGWINEAVELVIVDYVVPWRRQIGHYIEEVVRDWDPKEVTCIIELQVGHDLQFIRLNGTAIGALIGVLLFLAARAFGHA